MNPLIALLAIAAGYLLGSISFARLVTRWFAPGRDITDLKVDVVGTEEQVAGHEKDGRSPPTPGEVTVSRQWLEQKAW